MITCGIDVGSRSTKVIILNDSIAVAGRGHTLTGGKPAQAAETALAEALLAASLERNEIDWVTTTGYGRRLVTGHDSEATSVICHATAAYLTFPLTHHVIDIGALRTSAIRLDKNGNVHRFRLNDRCGAGIGRFLERVAESLEIPLEEMGQLALFSKDPQPIPSVCSVLGETEILNHITHGDKPADIIRGVCEALADRVASLVKQVRDPGGEVTLTGGIAKNAGMVKALEVALGSRINIHHDAEYMGAYGAAVIARDAVDGKSHSEISA